MPPFSNFPPGASKSALLVLTSERLKHSKLSQLRMKQGVAKKRAQDARKVLLKLEETLRICKNSLARVTSQVGRLWVMHSTFWSKCEKVSAGLIWPSVNFDKKRAKCIKYTRPLLLTELAGYNVRKANHSKAVKDMTTMVRNAEVVYSDLRELSLAADEAVEDEEPTAMITTPAFAAFSAEYAKYAAVRKEDLNVTRQANQAIGSIYSYQEQILTYQRRVREPVDDRLERAIAAAQINVGKVDDELKLDTAALQWVDGRMGPTEETAPVDAKTDPRLHGVRTKLANAEARLSKATLKFDLAEAHRKHPISQIKLDENKANLVNARRISAELNIRRDTTRAAVEAQHKVVRALNELYSLP